ncbi:MAG: hypothetical protein PHG35_07800 [Dehalococcoidales bacterium]|nr:hypothetical protein [Dehalococcoidales bacterium]
MKYLFVLLLPILFLCSCAQQTTATFPPPEGFSSWEEYNRLHLSTPTNAINENSLKYIQNKISNRLWTRIDIKSIGHIDYPADFLEIQSDEYRNIAKEYNSGLDFSKSDFVLQQTGLNELSPSALFKYRRVMFWTYYLDKGEEVLRPYVNYKLSKSELLELENRFNESALKDFENIKSMGLGDFKLVGNDSIEVLNVNGMFPVVYSYGRQLNDEPVVKVKMYMFPNYDKIHYLSFSNRLIDENECQPVFDDILDSFFLYLTPPDLD